ncbi:MAG: hypothetical protein RSF67_05195, partial [Clostridia bacterium]
KTVSLEQIEYIPPFKYINGAFKGILMRISYPPDTKTFKMFSDEEFIYYKHAPKTITDYYTSAENTSLYNKKEFIVDFNTFTINNKLITVEKQNEIIWD